MRAKSMLDTRWCAFIGDIYPVKVMFFIGSRKEMSESIAEALTGTESARFQAQKKEIIEKVRSEYSVELPSLEGECICVTASRGARLWIVRVREFDGTIECAALLSHECLHAAISVLDFLGVSEAPPFEVLCYTHEAIFKRFLRSASAHIGILKKYPTGK